ATEVGKAVSPTTARAFRRPGTRGKAVDEHPPSRGRARVRASSSRSVEAPAAMSRTPPATPARATNLEPGREIAPRRPEARAPAGQVDRCQRNAPPRPSAASPHENAASAPATPRPSHFEAERTRRPRPETTRVQSVGSSEPTPTDVALACASVLTLAER